MSGKDFLKEIDAILDGGETFSNVFLGEISDVNDIRDDELKNLLKHMYKSGDPAFNRLATIVNSVITQGQCTFLLSARLTIKLLEIDSNSKYKSVDSKTYKAMVAKMLVGTNMFEKVRSPVGRIAAVFKVKSPMLLSILYTDMGKEVYERQNKYVLDFYDSKCKEKKSEKKLKLPSFEDYLAKEEGQDG